MFRSKGRVYTFDPSEWERASDAEVVDAWLECISSVAKATATTTTSPTEDVSTPEPGEVAAYMPTPDANARHDNGLPVASDEEESIGVSGEQRRIEGERLEKGRLVMRKSHLKAKRAMMEKWHRAFAHSVAATTIQKIIRGALARTRVHQLRLELGKKLRKGDKIEVAQSRCGPLSTRSGVMGAGASSSCTVSDAALDGKIKEFEKEIAGLDELTTYTRLTTKYFSIPSEEAEAKRITNDAKDKAYAALVVKNSKQRDDRTFPAYHPRSDDAYTSVNSVNPMLERGDVALVDGKYLEKCPGPIEIRQNLPDGASFIGPLEDKTKKFEKFDLAKEILLMTVVAISYTWGVPYPPDPKIGVHPDPHKYYLHLVQSTLSVMRGTEEYKDIDVCFFWVRRALPRYSSSPSPRTHARSRTATLSQDWMSLYQNYKEGEWITPGERTEAQNEAFARCMDTMDLWYGGASMMIWMLTAVPPGSRAYFSRGWCVFEAKVGGLLTPADKALDIGKMGDPDTLERDYNLWFHADLPDSIGMRCAAAREPPLTPEQFFQLMDEHCESGPKIQFSVESDRDVIKGLYKTTFNAVIGHARAIDWQGLGWDTQLSTLVPIILPAKGTLQTLNLSSNKLRGPSRMKPAPTRYNKQKPIGTFLAFFRNNPGGDLRAYQSEVSDSGRQLPRRSVSAIRFPNCVEPVIRKDSRACAQAPSRHPSAT